MPEKLKDKTIMLEKLQNEYISRFVKSNFQKLTNKLHEVFCGATTTSSVNYTSHCTIFESATIT